jgi:carboxylesterase type B
MRKFVSAILLATAIFAMAPFAVSQIQTAKVTGGEVQGVVADGVATFKGIPFATHPMKPQHSGKSLSPQPNLKSRYNRDMARMQMPF